MSWIAAVKTDDIPLKEGRRLIYDNREIAIFNLGARFAAIDNLCPHKQGPLADGIVSENSVFCPLHNLNVCLATGCALKGGEGQVKTYTTRVQGGTVYIDL